MPTHSPLPWIAKEWKCHAKTSIISQDGSPNGRHVAECSNLGADREDAEADAAFICLAVNQHEALSARVAQLDTECQAAANLIGSQAARIARLEAALRKIRGHDRMCSDFQAAEDMTSIARQALRESQP